MHQLLQSTVICFQVGTFAPIGFLFEPKLPGWYYVVIAATLPLVLLVGMQLRLLYTELKKAIYTLYKAVKGQPSAVKKLSTAKHEAKSAAALLATLCWLGVLISYPLGGGYVEGGEAVLYCITAGAPLFLFLGTFIVKLEGHETLKRWLSIGSIAVSVAAFCIVVGVPGMMSTPGWVWRPWAFFGASVPVIVLYWGTIAYLAKGGNASLVTVGCCLFVAVPLGAVIPAILVCGMDPHNKAIFAIGVGFTSLMLVATAISGVLTASIGNIWLERRAKLAVHQMRTAVRKHKTLMSGEVARRIFNKFISCETEYSLLKNKAAKEKALKELEKWLFEGDLHRHPFDPKNDTIDPEDDHVSLVPVHGFEEYGMTEIVERTEALYDLTVPAAAQPQLVAAVSAVATSVATCCGCECCYGCCNPRIRECCFSCFHKCEDLGKECCKCCISQTFGDDVADLEAELEAQQKSRDVREYLFRVACFYGGNFAGRVSLSQARNFLQDAGLPQSALPDAALRALSFGASTPSELCNPLHR